MVELLSEPLYILAQLRLRLQLRVFAEASATLARGVATLALLKISVLDVGISLSVAQVRSCRIAEVSEGRQSHRRILMPMRIQQQKLKVYAESGT